MRRKQRDERRASDERARAATGIRARGHLSGSRTLAAAAAPRLTDFAAPPAAGAEAPAGADARDRVAGDRGATGPRVLDEARKCYVCKAPYRELHFFYNAMCPPCAALN